MLAAALPISYIASRMLLAPSPPPLAPFHAALRGR